MKLEILLEQNLNGEMQERRFEIEVNKDGVIIGRHAQDFMIRDSEVSSKHAMLFVNVKNRLALIDLGSRNGTRVNGKKLERTEIGIGDRIKVGNAFITILNASNEATDSSVLSHWPQMVESIPENKRRQLSSI